LPGFGVVDPVAAGLADELQDETGFGVGCFWAELVTPPAAPLG
jgi:hypothetical protein